MVCGYGGHYARPVRATSRWQKALQPKKDLIRAAMKGKLGAHSAPTKLFDACDKYLVAKEATANTERAVEFDRERLEVVKRHFGDVKLSAISRELIEGFQAKRRLEGVVSCR